jgi:hypothetical protein
VGLTRILHEWLLLASGAYSVPRREQFWLDPVRLARSKGFAAHELTRVEGLVVDNQARFLEAWREFFDS